MRSQSVLRGEMRQFEEPDWRPLEAVGRELLDMFMWMHEVEVDGGLHLHAYKHIDTRRYLHLSATGDAYDYFSPRGYRPIDLADALEDTLAPWWQDLGATIDEIAACITVIQRARSRS
jgi:hypothetical protein